MKKMFLALAFIGTMTADNTVKAQAWKTDDRPLTNPTSYYADRNGTYFFQPNPNNNMGTSPNNAMYKNQSDFYNKDNKVQNRFPESNGTHFIPGSQGQNYNANTPGSYNNNNVNNGPVPVYNGIYDPVK